MDKDQKKYSEKKLSLGCIFTKNAIIGVLCITMNSSLSASDKPPLRIMPLGDSITVGYTDNPHWKHPFEFGYRSNLCRRLTDAKINFEFVGKSPEPFNNKSGDPTHKGTVKPEFDLRKSNQDNHRGYGGWSINPIRKNISRWIKEDRPDIILLLIGINGISEKSPKQLDALVKEIYKADKNLKLIVAQITPLRKFNQNLFEYNAYIRDTLVPAYAEKGYAIKTVDLYNLFLKDPNDPKSIDPKRLFNRFNHPDNNHYDKMAEIWFQGIKEISDR
jgi:lysophospholipase L1-like esterase